MVVEWLSAESLNFSTVFHLLNGILRKRLAIKTKMNVSTVHIFVRSRCLFIGLRWKNASCTLTHSIAAINWHLFELTPLRFSFNPIDDHSFLIICWWFANMKTCTILTYINTDSHSHTAPPPSPIHVIGRRKAKRKNFFSTQNAQCTFECWGNES
jgi:hypothetical protein